MIKRLPITVLSLSLTPFVVAAFGQALVGCKKDEPPPPLATTAEAPATPPPVVTLAPPVDSTPEPVASASASVHRGTGAPGMSLRACCAALKQNAASMPPPQNGYALAAAAYCEGMVSNPAAREAALSGIRAALKGASMPSTCK